jgi:TorA maturation chaperone TorD
MEVDEDFLRTVSETKTLFKQLAESAEEELLKDGCLTLSDAIKDFEEDVDKSSLLTDLASEYASLFLNVGSSPVYLVESVYLGKHHLLYEEPYFEVLEAYKTFGFEKSPEFKEPEDHLAVELEFMAKLIDLTMRSIDENNLEYAKGYLNLQKEFLDDHLIKWVPQLCQKLEEASSSKFYKGLAKLLHGFIKVEEQFVPFIIDKISTVN